jgi:autotransporter-associated beta strand protein
MIPLFYSPISKAAVLLLLATSAIIQAANIEKANNSTALNLGTSWVGGNAPGINDIADYTSTVTLNLNTPLGGDLSFAGIRIGATGGSATTMTISGANTLTLGASGIDMSAANSNLAISSGLSLGANQTWNIASGRKLSTSGVVTGTGSLLISGSGTVEISGNANTYSGGTTIGSGSIVRINSSGNNTNTPFGSGGLTLNDNATITGISVGNRYINNAISLNGNATLGGLNASNTFYVTGGVDTGASTRTLNIVNASAPTSANTSLIFYGAGKSISGAGRLVLANGNGATSPEVWVRMGNSDSFTVSTDLTIGTGVSLYFNNSNILTNSTALTVDAGGTMDISNKGGSTIEQTIESLSGAGRVTSERNNAGISTLTINGGAATARSTFSGDVVTGTSGGSISVVKTGATTQVFSGANTYYGQTVVNQGTLLINGTHTDSANTTGNGYGGAAIGHFQVATGASFGGGGRIAGNNAQNNSNMVLVQSGGTLTPGDGIGTLTLDGANISGTNSRVLNMATGSEFAFQLSGDGTSADQVEFWNYTSGDLLLNSNAINLTLSGTVAAGTYTVNLFEFYSDSGVTFTTSGVTSGLVLGTLDSRIANASITYNSALGNISLQYTVVPEPGTWVLVGLGAFVILLARRKATRLDPR